MALLWKVRMLGPQLVVKLLGNRPWMVWALKETPACNPVWSSLCFQSTNTWEEAAMLFYFNELCPLPCCEGLKHPVQTAPPHLGCFCGVVPVTRKGTRRTGRDWVTVEEWKVPSWCWAPPNINIRTHCQQPASWERQHVENHHTPQPHTSPQLCPS